MRGGGIQSCEKELSRKVDCLMQFYALIILAW